MSAFRALAGALVSVVFSAQAHEGHGMLGAAHWHAGDSAGWIGLALIAGLAWAWGRRK